MTFESLDVFSLREFVVDEYKKYATSFTRIHAEDIRRKEDQVTAGSLGSATTQGEAASSLRVRAVKSTCAATVSTRKRYCRW
jgi:hypothetical protein